MVCSEGGSLLLGCFKPGLEVVGRVAQFVPLAADRGDLLLGLVDLLGKEAGFAGERFPLLIELPDARFGLGKLLLRALNGGQCAVPFFLEGGGERLGLFDLSGCALGLRPGGLRLRFELLPGFRQRGG